MLASLLKLTTAALCALELSVDGMWRRIDLTTAALHMLKVGVNSILRLEQAVRSYVMIMTFTCTAGLVLDKPAHMQSTQE